ncbi:MAG: phosphatase PAP2 family protein [Faecalibacterium sp.]
MDIEYLLLLQNFRESTNNVLTPLMMQISEFIIGIIPMLVVAMVYWVYSKKAGAWILLNVSGTYWLNGILKLTACVYRPWIRDSRVVPAQAAFASATGYSFPSGHSTFATAYYGCGALCCWKQKKTRALSVVMVFLLAATMFSRNYLGVHTPQDVLVGFAASALFLLVSIRLFRWMENGDQKRDLLVLVAGLCLMALSIVYIMAKPYPLDYVDGVLLVDPEKMKPDTISGVAAVVGWLLGWYLERRFVRFENPTNKRKGFVIGALACVPLVLWMLCLQKYATPLIGKMMVKILILSVPMVYILAVVPFLIKKLTAVTQKR